MHSNVGAHTTEGIPLVATKSAHKCLDAAVGLHVPLCCGRRRADHGAARAAPSRGDRRGHAGGGGNALLAVMTGP